MNKIIKYAYATVILLGWQIVAASTEDEIKIVIDQAQQQLEEGMRLDQSHVNFLATRLHTSNYGSELTNDELSDYANRLTLALIESIKYGLFEECLDASIDESKAANASEVTSANILTQQARESFQGNPLMEYAVQLIENPGPEGITTDRMRYLNSVIGKLAKEENQRKIAVEKTPEDLDS
ncbi:MAG: hypothetical protein LBJ92_03070 [Holosporales bacterium]|jgi:hypothetical protein|nr:hypothetical protein [Holosporales bacterium]